ncbi:hypothetical protein LMG1866_06297 [Achromobacter ruhlandii]|nr:hypothetical protein LMG1866_06297 [Achromobacter ruhlandii]
MVVTPRYAVLLPSKVRVLVPFLVTVPAPEITPAWATASLRSNTSAAFSASEIGPATEPVTPPSPSRSVPPSTVVRPV